MTSNATTQTEALLLTETKDGVATVTLNRPGQFNALSSALIDELQSTFDRLAADSTIRVVVLAANGRGFCAGHDLKEIRAMGSVPDVEALFARCSRMMMTITTLPQPVIARVHGIAPAASWSPPATSRWPPRRRPSPRRASTSAPSVPRPASRSDGRSAANTPWRC